MDDTTHIQEVERYLGDRDPSGYMFAGLVLSLRLAFEHPEYARALYQELVIWEPTIPPEIGNTISDTCATILTEAIPYEQVTTL